MITAVKKTLRGVARSTLKALESLLQVDPVSSHDVRWFDKELQEGVFNREGGKAGDDGILWKEGDKVPSTGVCKLDSAKLWMISPAPHRMRPKDQRKVIVLDKNYRPVIVAGLPHLWVFFLKYDWRGLVSAIISRKTLKGSVAVLGGYEFETKNYYHFWVDTIADLWFIKQQLPESEMPERYLIHFAGLPWQWEILEMCGVDVKRVIPICDHRFLEVGTAVIPIRAKGALNFSPWLAEAIRLVSGWQNKDHLAYNKIYISRADASRRNVVNESEVCELLAAEGFKIYSLNGFSVRQQQILFSSASVIFSPHGAALTNLVWCKPGAIVVDFLNENYLVPCFRELARQSGVIYQPVVCNEVPSGGMVYENDIYIPLDKVLEACCFVSGEVVGCCEASE